jgi:hypothetical protein
MRKCEHCRKCPAAFRLKHGETSVHWRCLGCFRDIARQAPVAVVGVATPARIIEHRLSLVRLGRVVDALLDLFRAERGDAVKIAAQFGPEARAALLSAADGDWGTRTSIPAIKLYSWRCGCGWRCESVVCPSPQWELTALGGEAAAIVRAESGEARS